jgi:hypothetical protein
MSEETKPDFVSKSGIEITFDLDAISHKEWSGLFDAKEPVAISDVTLAKAGNIELEVLEGLSQADYKRYIRALVKRASQPLTDPNA